MIDQISEHSPPSPNTLPPSRRKIVLGHLWQILTFIPFQIFSLFVKIKDIFAIHLLHLLKRSSAEFSQEKHKITAEPVPPITSFPLDEKKKREMISRVIASDTEPDLLYVMDPSLKQQNIQKTGEARKTSPLSKQLDQELEAESAIPYLFIEEDKPTLYTVQNQIEVVSEDVSISEPKGEVESESVSSLSIENLEALPAVQSVAQLEPIIEVKERVKIDMPDDGNCLFYALSTGIRKKYHTIPAIQDKLKWEINPNELIGDLSKKADLLKEPASNLRQQAADFLIKNQDDEMVMVALFGAIDEHNPNVQRRIQDLESLTVVLFQDIEDLQNMSQTEDIQTQLYQKIIHLESIQQAIEKENQNFVEEGDIPSYIEKSKQDHFYCDAAHIYALSHYYEIPVIVISKYGKSDQSEDTYNPEAAFSLAPITIAHVNGNHYVYIDT